MFKVIVFIVMGLASTSILAVKVNFGGGGQADVQAHDQVSAFESMNRWFRYLQDREKLIQKGQLTVGESLGAHALYDFPLKTTQSQYGYYGISNFVDQNPNFPNQLEDYNGGMRTYDVDNGYNHQGIDYFTWPYGWYKMDQNQVHVIAAEAGTITTKIDGNYDRSCSFNDPNDQGWNAVYVTHSDGSYVFYGHMKSGSLTAKLVGQTVEVGEYLGVVGSSGTSTGPHLHFETYDASDNLVEPYFGAFNVMNDDSWWRDQEPYHNSRINQLITHAGIPEVLGCADENEESTDEVQFFEGGETVYLAAYYRDQLDSQTTLYQVLSPNNSVLAQWSHSADNYYAASYWYWTVVLANSPQPGRYTFRASYEAQIVDQYFWVGELIFSNSFD